MFASHYTYPAVKDEIATMSKRKKKTGTKKRKGGNVAKLALRYPDDLRRVVATEMTPDGNLQVHWDESDRIVPASFGAAREETETPQAKRRRPIAERLINKMKRHTRAKVVDFQTQMIGRKNAEELQKTVVTSERLANHHAAHAIYVYAQNQASVMAEQLTELKEMEHFDKLSQRPRNSTCRAARR